MEPVSQDERDVLHADRNSTESPLFPLEQLFCVEPRQRAVDDSTSTTETFDLAQNLLLAAPLARGVSGNFTRSIGSLPVDDFRERRERVDWLFLDRLQGFSDGIDFIFNHKMRCHSQQNQLKFGSKLF